VKIAIPATASALGVALFLAFTLQSEDRTVFMPGSTSDGHHQIEGSCDSCHRSEFASADDVQASCIECHGSQLAASDDSHPKRKFTDPRNADRIEILDARYCVTCHREHTPDFTLAMGLTLQADYCYRCHEDVDQERPSHVGLPFDGCASGGCHNFHDNRALYEDFLGKHLGEPDLRDDPFVRRIVWLTEPGHRLGAPQADAPAALDERASQVTEWSGTAHAQGGVNCSDCHARGDEWRDEVGIAVCSECHADQRAGFEQGRHGMRIGLDLSPMRPGGARLPMHAEASDRQLDCNACHPSHEYDLEIAAVESCTGCHADNHTAAYADSPHAALFTAELDGSGEPGSGVSCATCHMPRIEHAGVVHVQHDQNDTLRPNEKMIRAVCLDCHGLGFSLDALADDELVGRNFKGRPSRSVESLDWVARRAP